jgi:Domain of unknown function (DUF1707)
VVLDRPAPPRALHEQRRVGFYQRPEEFDERSRRALQARTVRKLKELFTDLPRGQARATGAATAATGAGPAAKPGLPAARIVLVAGAAIAAITIVAGVVAGRGAGHHGLFLPAPIIVILFIICKAVLGGRRGYARGRLGYDGERPGYARDRLEGRFGPRDVGSRPGRPPDRSADAGGCFIGEDL